MDKPVVYVRFMEEKDLDSVVECDYKRNEFIDEDFGTLTREWTWDRKKILDKVKQRKNVKKGTVDTRAFVAEVALDNNFKVLGSYIYEIYAKGFEIVFFTVFSPSENKEEKLSVENSVREAMLESIYSKLDRSEGRDKISFSIPDGDYDNLKFFMQKGFETKMVKPTNCWQCFKEISKS